MNDIDIFEKRLEIYARDNYRCQYEGCTVCGADNLQLAHRISKGHAGVNWITNYIYWEYGIVYTSKEAKRLFIHNKKNMVTSCVKHNDYFNILNKKEQAKKLVDEMIDEIL